MFSLTRQAGGSLRAGDFLLHQIVDEFVLRQLLQPFLQSAILLLESFVVVLQDGHRVFALSRDEKVTFVVRHRRALT